MPWNDDAKGGQSHNNNQGPWGAPPNGGRKPANGGQQAPDLEDLIRSMQKGLGGFGNRGGGGRRGGGKGMGAGLPVLIGAGLVAFWVLTGSFFQVGPAEAGVVLRLGQYERTSLAGLHIKLPAPFETVEKIDILEVKSTPIPSPNNSRRANADMDSLMLTGDENIVDLTFNVQWRINDAEKYLFNVQDPETALRTVAESVMREVIGQSNVRPIISNEIGGIAERVRQGIQTSLDRYEAGITITEVNMERPTLPQSDNPAERNNPSADPLAAFRDVENAEQEKQKTIQDARAYANQEVPKARGNAQRLIEEANAYRDSVIAEANGQAERFRAIYNEYRAAPQVTRQRMYLETMERVLQRSNKVLLDDDGAGVVPYLPLNELNRSRP